MNWPQAGGSQLVFRAVICLLIGAVSAFAQDKVIRLRNERISTPPKAASSLQPQVVESPVSGLFLVQFNDRLQPGWRDQLRGMRVELVRYVPEDAFIARFDAVSPGQVKRLSFVRWIGPYLPEHKIDSRLKTGGRSQVRVLISPAASAKDLATVHRSVRSLGKETKLRFGNILKGQVTPAQLATLAKSDAVLWIEPEPKPKLVDEISSKIVWDPLESTCRHASLSIL